MFVFFTYLITNIAGLKFYTIRLIPFLSGIVSVPLFYLLAKTMYKGKLPIIVSTFLFAVSVPLIYYSQEFKPYSLDVLICILLLLVYKYIKITDTKWYQTLIYCVSTIFLCLSSFPALYIIPAIGISKIIETKKIKESLKTMYPVVLCYIFSVVYLFFLHRNILGNEINQPEWQNGFLKFSAESFYIVIRDYFDFTCINPQIGILLFVVGVVFVILERNKNFNVIFSIMLLSLIGSFIHLYPLFGRMILFMIPLTTIIIVKPLDSIGIFEKVDIKAKLFDLLKSILISLFIINSLIYVDIFFNFHKLGKNIYLVERFWEKQSVIETDKIYKKFLNEYNNQDKIVAMYKNKHDLIVYNKLLKYNDDLKDKIISLENGNWYEEIENYTQTLGENLWLIIDSLVFEKPIEEFNSDIKSMLDEKHIQYKEMCNGKEVIIYYITLPKK